MKTGKCPVCPVGAIIRGYHFCATQFPNAYIYNSATLRRRSEIQHNKILLLNIILFRKIQKIVKLNIYFFF